MNSYRISLLSLFFLFQISGVGFAQNVNWKRVNPENKHLVSAGVGLSYGTVVFVGYGYWLPVSPKIPILLNTEFSSPFGNRLLDDFKTKLGAQAELLRVGHFSAAVKVSGVFRRVETISVRLQNFGSETGAVLGFYKRKWYVATEFVFDKAITTQLKHGPDMRENNPEIRDGWYIPTGGNFLYGIQSGFSFRNNDIHLSLGKSVTQDFKTKPYIPLYFQLGYNRRF